MGGAASRGDVQELRRTMELLEAQLRQLERPQGRPDANDRVTQIGAMREGRNPAIIIRIYDLSDLFAMSPSYPAMRLTDLGGMSTSIFPVAAAKELNGSAGGMMGGMGGGMFNVPASVTVPETRTSTLRQMGGQQNNTSADAPGGRATIDELINAIQQTIAPDHWDSNGGEASIARVGTSLLISANQPMHEQIDALLNLFRQRWRTLRSITVRADWLWLTAGELNGLLGEHADRARDAGTTVVDEKVWAKLLDDEHNDANHHRAYNAALTCYNGQTVHTESGGQSLAVTNMTPIVQQVLDAKAPEPVLFDPTVTVVQEGAALQITPVATKSATHVVLDVHSRVARLKKPAVKQAQISAKEQTIRATPAEIVDAIDRPVLTTHRLSTTLRVPTNQTVLVGGMTFESQPEAGDPNLYLFVKTSVQDLREEAPVVEKSPAAPPQAVPTDAKPTSSSPPDEQ
ncbi:MAG TPA: hypothetical protein VGN12_23870 [Pirellulales bacterium]